MIILNKKRILLALSMILISMFVFTIQIAEDEKTIETVALPVSDKVIVIDAGHGKPDERSREHCSERQRQKLI